MSTTRLAIKMGSEKTSIYLEKIGVVLSEPTLMLYKGQAIHSVGQKAFLNIENDLDDSLSIVRPVVNGKIDNVLSAASILRIFLSKIVEDFSSRIVALVCVPCGLSASEKKDYLSVVYKAGISTAYLCPTPVCSFFDSPELVFDGCGLLANMGSQCCDVAFVENGNITAGHTIEFDNANIDKAIVKMLEFKYEILVTEQLAKHLKQSVCNMNFAVTLDKLVTGIGTKTGAVKKVRVSALDVSGVVKNFYDLVFDEIIELKSQVCKEKPVQLYLTGAPAEAGYLKEYAKQYTGLNVFCGNQNSAVCGLGKILEDEKLFSRIIKKRK